MNTRTLLFSLVCFTMLNICFSQKEQCESPKEQLIEDLSSITKCAIEKWEDSNSKGKTTTKQLAIRLTSRRKLISRALIKRKKREASSLTAIKSEGLSSIDVKKDDTNIVDVKTEIDDSVVLPFAMVESKPTFKECIEKNNSECFNKIMIKHIKKHFTYPEDAYKKGIEGKVMVRFNINKSGEITNIKATTSYEKEPLKLEAERIISELPNFSPAKHTNKLVNVSYGVPIVFKINNAANKRKIEKELIAISFDEVDEVPIFNSCSEDSSTENAAKCFNIEMVKHIQNNFSYPKLAIKKNITGKVWVSFIIDTKGEIRNIKLRGDSYILKTEAKRIISLLPKLKSGKHNGKKVNTKYVLPINFALN